MRVRKTNTPKTRVSLLLWCWAVAAFGPVVPSALGQSSDTPPASQPQSDPEAGINWHNIFLESFEFLGLEHGFRYWTEEATRNPHVSFFGGYVSSLNNLHGWADGDPFYVNYVGHPMQGAVSSFIFIQNDGNARMLEFGKNRPYWKSRLRAAAFAWAYSEQFEIGPVSEATIGNVQAFHPQQGLVDQVATPAIGLAWTIAEDAIDKYFIKRIESRTKNPFVWAAVRGGLNPSRSLANAFAIQYPWHRYNRLDPLDRHRTYQDVPPLPEPRDDYPLAAPYEFFAVTRTSAAIGRGAKGACIGGGGSMAVRVARFWEIAGEISGCKLTNFGQNLSGDSLTFLAGPRWTLRPTKRWQPFLQVLIGGRKLTHEKIDPAKKAQVEAQNFLDGTLLTEAEYESYTQLREGSGLAVAAGAGIDLKLRQAIGLRVAQLDYLHSWNSVISGINYANTFQFTSGLILRIGTW